MTAMQAVAGRMQGEDGSEGERPYGSKDLDPQGNRLAHRVSTVVTRERMLFYVMPKKSSRTKAAVCPVTGRELPGPMDHRAARSRAAIQAAFLGLVVERGYDAVDVQEVCTKATVSRATFYAHFSSKDDLKRKGIEHMRRELAQSIDVSASDPRAFAFSATLFEHARQHLALYRALHGTRGASVPHEALNDALRDLVRRDLTVQGQRAAMAMTVEYYAGALFSVLTWWLDDGARRPPSELDAEFRRLASIPSVRRVGAL